MFSDTTARLLLTFQVGLLLSSTHSVGLGEVINVDAGRADSGKTATTPVGNIGLRFVPSIITANVGDVVVFHFFPGNHSVVQSSFDEPCQPLDPDENGGTPPIYAGFFPAAEGDQNSTQFALSINTTDPIWLYCAQTLTNACQNGMTLVINPPTNNTNQTHDAYNYAAMGTAKSTEPGTIFGGVFEANNVTEANSVLNITTYPASPSESNSASAASSGAGATVTSVSHSGAAESSSRLGVAGTMVLMAAVGMGLMMA